MRDNNLTTEISVNYSLTQVIYSVYHFLDFSFIHLKCAMQKCVKNIAISTGL